MRVVALPIVCQPLAARGAALGLLLFAALGGCGRTGLDPGGLDDAEPAGAGGALNGAAGSATSSGAPTLPAAGTPPVTHAGAAATAPRDCLPSTEACNGRDDDCNGAIDDMPAEACAGGGLRLCVAGRMSECPRRCDVCVPGSQRICQNSFCTFWGEQQCAADGQGFGRCREAEPPPECAGIAREHQDSSELERCCIDNGYCCLDEHDLDHDGNRSEMLGACGDVSCQ